MSEITEKVKNFFTGRWYDLYRGRDGSKLVLLVKGMEWKQARCKADEWIDTPIVGRHAVIKNHYTEKIIYLDGVSTEKHFGLAMKKFFSTFLRTLLQILG